MPSRATQLKLLSLQKQCQALTRQAEQLKRVQALLLQKQSLLKAICDAFSQINASRATQDLPLDLEYFLSLMEKEAKLLQQLEQTEGDTNPAGQDTLGGVLKTISPRNAPMSFYMLLLSKPIAAEAEHITAHGLAQLLASTVKEASIQLHLLQDGAMDVQAQCLGNMERLWTR
jgi:hypothetical protein